MIIRVAVNVSFLGHALVTGGRALCGHCSPKIVTCTGRGVDTRAVTAPMRRSEEYRLRSMLTSNKVRFGSTRDFAYSLLMEERAIPLPDTHAQTSVNATESMQSTQK